LLRSMAKMVALVDAVVVIVFMMQGPRGGVGVVCVVTFRLPRPHGFPMNCTDYGPPGAAGGAKVA